MCATRHTQRDANDLKDDMSIHNTHPGGESQNFKGKQAAEQRKKARNTAERASESPPETRPEVAVDAFTAALTSVSA